MWIEALVTVTSIIAAVIYWLHSTGQLVRKEQLTSNPFGGAAPLAADPFGDTDEWLQVGLGVELPHEDIEAYDKAAEQLKGLNRTAPEIQGLHQECINKLMQRACASLLATWKASIEVDRLYRMRRTNRLSLEEWEQVEAEFEFFKDERAAVAQQASWLRPGWPGGWGESVFHDAHRAVAKARERMIADGHDLTDDKLPSAGKLRFAPNERVQCNLGKDPSGNTRWMSGTVITSWDLPYKVCLDNGARVTAPQVKHPLRLLALSLPTNLPHLGLYRILPIPIV